MDPRFTLLLGCFFLSGFAALLYQTAWTRELSFVFGTSELAVAAVLAAYMGGLALGAAAAGRFAMRIRRPVLAYGLLELGIALSAVAVPAGIFGINAVYVSLLGGQSELAEGGGATAAALFQLGAAFAVLLPPTAFMGATLPLLARHAVTSEAEIGRRVGVLYAVNTVGAIAGALCAAFWLMPELGLRRTVWVGVALNGVVFVFAARLSRGASSPSPLDASLSNASLSSASLSSALLLKEPRGAPAARGAAWILPAIALSGMVSFAYEVLWTRLLGNVLGASLDAFATMLAGFLSGIALGSAAAARLATSRERAVIGFGVAQLGIACASYAAFALADRLPEFSRAVGAGPGVPLASAAVAVAVLLPITLCIGATFPFAVRLLAQSPQQASRATARVYAFNTVGAIVGALGAGFVLLPAVGFAGTVNLGVAVSLVLALLAALHATSRRWLLLAAPAAAMLALLVLPARTPWALLSSSPLLGRPPPGKIAFAAVGRSSTVLLFEQPRAFRLYSNGLPEAAIERTGAPPSASLGHLLGLLPALVRPEGRDLLVVGLGGGTALEAVPSTLASIDVVELEVEVLTANQLVADERAVDPLSDPRVRVHIGDARGALQLSDKRYDAIVSQPSHPWTAGASHLYTREFFTLVRSRLKQGGVFVQWIGLDYLDEALLRSLAATLVDVFGRVEVFHPGALPGIVFAASLEPLDTLEGARRALGAAPEDLGRSGIHRVEDVAATRALDADGTRALAEGAPLNTDDHNLLAAHASRLGEAALDERSVRSLFKAHEPLLRGIDGLDRFALIRILVDGGAQQRATELALAGEGALEETGLGWIELGLGRPGRASRHFTRALELAPGTHEAVTREGVTLEALTYEATAGWVASRSVDQGEFESITGIAFQDLDPRILALVHARQSAAAYDLAAVEALDADLSRIAPGEGLFEEASRLRASWRLASGSSTAIAEAQAIVETLLVRHWTASDALLHARISIAAGEFRAASASLIRVAEMLPRHSKPADLRVAVLEVAEKLPEEEFVDLRAQLETSAAAPADPRDEP